MLARTTIGAAMLATALCLPLTGALSQESRSSRATGKASGAE